MSEISSGKRDLSDLEVAAFLRRRPEFLTEFPDLAMVLKVPRQVGSTTSLASYQLDVLREKNRALHRRLTELVGIAEDNEQLVLRVHALTLALIRAPQLDDALARVVATLHEDFGASDVCLVLYQALPGIEPQPWLRYAQPESAALLVFADFLGQTDALCGRLKEEKLEYLFAERAAHCGSAAMVRIDARGFLAIAHPDPNHYFPGMGTLFLRLLAEALDAVIGRFAAR